MLIAQVPAEHTEEALASVQARPHRPQFARLVRMSTSQPSAALPLQLPKPGAHEATVQAPSAHPAVAFEREHSRPHSPQWAGVVLRSVSQPFAAFPSQSPKPAAQEWRQDPSSQFTALFGRAAQAEPQAPQWDPLVAVLVSQPFIALPSQSAKGAVQIASPHTPLRQTGTPFMTVQPRSQAPQFAVLVCGSAHAPPQQVCPDGHARVAVQPGTQMFPTQRLPAAHCSSRRQSTQARVSGLQRRSTTPPSRASRHARSSRQPGAQRVIPGTQYWPAGQRSLAAVQGTQRPVAVSHAGPWALPAQAALVVQEGGMSTAAGTSTAGTSRPPASSAPSSIEGEASPTAGRSPSGVAPWPASTEAGGAEVQPQALAMRPRKVMTVAMPIWRMMDSPVRPARSVASTTPFPEGTSNALLSGRVVVEEIARTGAVSGGDSATNPCSSPCRDP